MKGNEIDDLFRQKLRHQKLAPPPSAWEAVEQNLPDKKKKGGYLWISIAASLLVIATLGWLVISGGTQAPVDNQQLQAKNEVQKALPQAEQTAEPLVAEVQEKPAMVENQAEEQAPKLLVAINTPETTTVLSTPEPEEATEFPIAELKPTRAIVAIRQIDIVDNLTVEMTASRFRNDLVMPLNLTAYYIPYTEDLKLAPKKKKFRVLNGIISIAKEVNTGKLSFSELRNAKNNFVVDDLKYGSKEIDSDSGEGEDEDRPDAPGKD